MKKPRVAIVVSHPIQHCCPQYASLARSTEYDLCVFFASTVGAVPYKDTNFNKTIQWDNLNLGAFNHVFLSDRPVPSSKYLDATNLSRQLDEFNPDVVIVYGYWQRFQKRVKEWVRNNERLMYYISDSECHRCETAARRRLKAILIRRHFLHIDRFLTVGNANEFFYHSHGVPTVRMTRMHFPIDVEQFERAYQQRMALRM